LATKKNQELSQQFWLPIALTYSERGTASEEPHDHRPSKIRRKNSLGTKIATTLANPASFSRLKRPETSPVYTTYWKFAKARQDLFFAQLAGHGATEADPILQRYRFTNVYRASDRVSQYLIRQVLYGRKWSAIDLVFRLLIFKFFNKIETWEALEREVGVVCWETYDFSRYDCCLTKIMTSAKTIYSAAYIMPSGRTTFGFERKHKNHLKVIEAIISARFPERVADCSDFESVFHLLREFPCIGPFIAYQFAIDLNYSSLLNFSENDFVEPGPGALDGIAKCFSNLGDLTPADAIRYMTDVQDEAFETFAPGFRTLWGRRLHLIDCQNLFCEVGKYARVAHPEIGGPSKRVRIKQTYKPSSRAFETPWFPPKWGLNGLIAPDFGA
jgi:alpha-glutamyl/putrescinyl thymine pyrophosphorylase clade 1